MAFNPMYASTPGRPVNLRRDIGAALDEMPFEAPEAAPSAPSGFSFRDRATGFASAVADGIDPRTSSSVLQVFGGAARGFTGVQNYLKALTGEREEAASGREGTRLNRERVIATTEAERARAESERAQAERARQGPAPVVPEWQKQGYPSFEAWQRDRTRPTAARPPAPQLKVGEDGFQYQLGSDGKWHKSLDERGQPFRPRPTGTPGRGRTGTTAPTTPAAPAKSLSQEDYDLLKADGMTDDEMQAAGYTLPR